MHTTAATVEAVDHIFSNLWERGQLELSILGIDLETARHIAYNEHYIGAPTQALWFDDEPVLICGLMRIDNPFGMRTWFQATDLFGVHAKTITSQMKEMMAEGARQYNLDFIETISPCVHPKTGRWFGAMGLAIDIDYHIKSRGGEKLYRFERRFAKGE